MRPCIKNLFLLPVLVADLGLILSGRATAQTFATLYSFSGGDDGYDLEAGLAISGSTLYGTTFYGGNTGNGTVFKVNTDGTGFTNLYSFTATTYPSYTNRDGAHPSANLVLAGDTLYGTANYGGIWGNGALFAIKTNGTSFTNFHSFSATSGFRGPNGDGAGGAGLVVSGNTLYGNAYRGGDSGYGTIFSVNTDGTEFTTLHSFTSAANDSHTNSDGAGPHPTVILSGNVLYGTAAEGGAFANGTVFRLNTDGTGFTNLYSFTAGNDNSLGYYTNSDGAEPWAGLVLSGGTLFGTTIFGGGSGNGTVFAVNTDGTSFRTLHNFTATSEPFNTNSDGVSPYAELVLSGNTLYGTTPYGGNSGEGTLFAINADGTGFTNLHAFTAESASSPYTNFDGASPKAGLLLSGYTMYGTASYGGGFGKGTVFSISFSPQLTIGPSGLDVLLAWPTNVAGFDYSGFTLQSTTNLVSPTVWTNVSPAPVVVNGQNTVTNPISGTQQFYRLGQ